MRKPQEVLLRPVISEKSFQMMEDGKYVFIVHPRANKIEIKNAVEVIFNVNVRKVNTLKVKRKPKRFGRYEGRTPERKKAIIALEPGEKIDAFENLS